MTLYDISKTNFIIISKNNINYSNKNGIKINIKGEIPENISNNQYIILQNIDSNKLKNRVIFSGKSNYDNNNLILLTQQNLNHNIKLIYKKNPLTNIHDLNQPRIIFKKYSIYKDILFNNQFLFSCPDTVDNSFRLNNIKFQNQTFNIYNSNNDLDNLNSKLNKITITYNVYHQYENSNFFKFNFNDFINTNTYNDLSNNLFIKINDISCNKDNNNMFNNISYENIYKIIDNSNLLLLNNTDYDYFKNSIDYSNNTQNDYFIFNSVNNLTDLSINFQKLDTLSNTYTNYSEFENIGKIYFFVNKYKYFEPEYNYFKNKIILNKHFTYLNNKILNNNSNFYSNNNLINDTSKVYLSFGNSILGLTKLNLFNNFYFTNNKIFILKDNKFYNNYSNLDSTSNYLIDDSGSEKYDYSYYRKFVTYNFLNLEFKLLDYDLSQNFNEIFDLNNYINGFQNNYIINEENISISPDLQKDSDFYDNYSLQKFLIYDISFDKLNYNLKINNNDLTNNLINEINITDNNLNINFKFNYKSNFNVFINLQLNYDNLYNYLNDYLINFSLNINTEEGLNFDNINCIYIYHNPLTEIDPSFLYPNNNIEIDYNPSFDTLTRVIERDENTLKNKTFTIIPEKNASNLSKKQIIGLIGLNNIPKLLSIKPYDESFIEGRGFLNQYSINDECLNYNDKVLFKLNSQNHTSVKERNSLTNNTNINSYSKKMNYVKLVNNRKLNTNIKTDCSITSNNPNNITNYYTPFKLYRKR